MLTINQFNQEVEYLKTFFPTFNRIEGTIVRPDTRGEFNNYQDMVESPMKENTLIMLKSRYPKEKNLQNLAFIYQQNDVYKGLLAHCTKTWCLKVFCATY